MNYHNYMKSRRSSFLPISLLLMLFMSTMQIQEGKAQDPFIGEIRLFGFNFAPQGWAKCEGQILPIAQNQALFSLLGTTYGGDGQTTFALPDLRGRVAMGCGNGPGLTSRTLGQKPGQETHTLTVNEMPSHNHALTGEVKSPVSAADSDSDDPTNSYNGVTTIDMYTSNLSPGEYAAPLENTLQVANNGGGQPHNNVQPCLVLNYCIALTGIFPSQN